MRPLLLLLTLTSLNCTTRTISPPHAPWYDVVVTRRDTNTDRTVIYRFAPHVVRVTLLDHTPDPNTPTNLQHLPPAPRELWTSTPTQAQRTQLAAYLETFAFPDASQTFRGLPADPVSTRIQVTRPTLSNDTTYLRSYHPLIAALCEQLSAQLPEPYRFTLHPHLPLEPLRAPTSNPAPPTNARATQ